MLFLPTLLKGIGAGISALSGFSSASQTRSTGTVNFALSASNAALARDTELSALSLERTRSEIDLTNVQANTQLALMDAQTREANAQRMREFSEATTDKSREAIRRQRREFNRFRSRQEAIIGKSGVAFSGSAIDVLAETAGQMTLTLQDMADQANINRSDALNQAELESFAGRQQRIAAQSSLASARAGNALNASAVHFGKLAAERRYNTAMFGAQMGLDMSQQSARGTGISTIAGMVGAGADIYRMNRIASDDQVNYRATT